jgi:galactose mutarotase-like enzyme
MEFTDLERLAIFPFAHELAVTMALSGHTLEVATSVTNRGGGPMPISFGWHPYFRLPEVPRELWRVGLPIITRAELDERQLPTGRDHPAPAQPPLLADRTYDDLFPELSEPRVFTLSGAGRALRVAFGNGYPLAQVYAPRTADVIAFEPMTAPTNALITGAGLRWIGPGDGFEATFSVSINRVSD